MAEYVLSGERWASNTISWSFEAYNFQSDAANAFTHSIGDATEKSLVRQAFATWEGVANITFNETADSSIYSQLADIRIGFGDLGTNRGGSTIGLTSSHWNGKYYSPDTIIRLEDPNYVPISYDQAGTLKYSGYDSTFYQIVLHEIGHALGLEHSSDPTAIMYPTSQSSNRDLSIADIHGIQAVYGAPAAQPHQIASFHGPRSSYTITYSGNGTATVKDSVTSRDGTYTSINKEVLQFTDQAYFIETGDRANIARLYSAALNRTPDTGGLFNWEDIYDRNLSAAVKAQGVYPSLAQTSGNFNGNLSIADGFIRSPEFSAKYGTLSDSDFVTQLYRNVLSRAPEPPGINGWLDLMSKGDASGTKFTRAMVLVGFAESNENIAKTSVWLTDMSRSG